MIKNILFDFDGVILDSMMIKEFGFRDIFKQYNKSDVDTFIDFHKQNGGLSRFFKIRYFYENILQKSISDDKVLDYANKFGLIMKKELCDKKYLIVDTLNFIKANYLNLNLHIVSGTEQCELRFLCEKLQILQYFKTIKGSPAVKKDLVRNILDVYKYKRKQTILIGDSINDYEAAKENELDFYGFNNEILKSISKKYIEDFKRLKL